MNIEDAIADLQRQINDLNTNRLTKTNIVPGAILPQALSVTQNPTTGDIYYSNGTNFSILPIGDSGNLLTVANGAPAWFPNGDNAEVLTMSGGVPTWAVSSATKPIAVTATSSGDFTTTSTSYVDSSATTSSVSITVAVTSNIFISVTGGAQNDTDAGFYTVGIGKGTNTAVITRTVDPAHVSIGNIFTLTYMDMSVSAGTYVYHMGASSQTGKTTRIASGSVITAIALPA